MAVGNEKSQSTTSERQLNCHKWLKTYFALASIIIIIVISDVVFLATALVTVQMCTRHCAFGALLCVSPSLPVAFVFTPVVYSFFNPVITSIK